MNQNGGAGRCSSFSFQATNYSASICITRILQKSFAGSLKGHPSIWEICLRRRGIYGEYLLVENVKSPRGKRLAMEASSHRGRSSWLMVQSRLLSYCFRGILIFYAVQRWRMLIGISGNSPVCLNLSRSLSTWPYPHPRAVRGPEWRCKISCFPIDRNSSRFLVIRAVPDIF